MSAKHTPGPWHLAKETTRGQFVRDYRIRDKADGLIATLGPVDQDANAALIAAAPDLLAALEALDFCLDSTTPEMQRAMALIRPAREQAKAAIAKARGQS